MTTTRRFDAMRDLLDHELLDADGVSCGMVDDMEIAPTSGGMAVVALLVGPGAWDARLPALLRVVVRHVTGRKRVRIPFDQVARINEVVELRSRAASLALGVVDRKVGKWLARLPST
jgi:sporulation protein YlmC with PRC-barrel domain